MPARTTPLKRKPGAKAGGSPLRWVADPAKRLERICDVLEAELGVPVWEGPRDGLEVLVLTVLSQNTTDLNALRGYAQLCQRYPRAGGEKSNIKAKNPDAIPRLADGSVDPVAIRLSQVADAFDSPDWERVRTMPQRELEDAIRPAGLPASKAGAIQRVLNWLVERTDTWRLEDALAGMDHVAAAAQLSSLKGIGPKTAAVTLIEATGADLCPVDTHVHRLVGRMGIVDTNADRDRTYKLLQALMPSGRGFALHHNLLTLGRTVCLARGPKCAECPVRPLCKEGSGSG